jgi:PAS domain S-box-containing protein
MQPEQSTAPQILAILKRKPRGMTITDIAKEANLHRNTVATQLEIMHVAGQVELRSIGSAKVYSCAQRIPLSAFLCFTRNLILVLDANLRIVQANDQFLKLANRSKADLIGQIIDDVTLPVVSTPEAQAVIGGLGREQIVTDIHYEHAGTESFYQLQVIPTTFEDGEKGSTLVLEDITERKRYVQNMEFLARTAMELVDMPKDADMYQYIAKQIIELVPNARVFVLYFDEITTSFTLRVTMGGDFHEGLIQILGRDPIGLVMPMTEIFSMPSGGAPATLLHGGLQERIFYPEIGPEGLSLYDLCFRQIPEPLCEKIRERWNLGKVYITFLVWGDQLFGDVGIFMTPDEMLEDRQTIESFLRQASIALARRQTEERLGRSEARFREVLDLSPTAAAIIDTDGRYTFVNQRFTDLFGYTLVDIPTGREWFARAFPEPTEREAAITAWKGDLAQAGPGQVRQRTFAVQCRNGERKSVSFRSVTLTDGNQYVTYEQMPRPSP